LRYDATDDAVFQALMLALSRNATTIVETGTLRVPGNWAFDGQSTRRLTALDVETPRVMESDAMKWPERGDPVTLHELGTTSARRRHRAASRMRGLSAAVRRQP
jgi:hypothetical protein